ncbi:MAG: hypothetical protein H7323_13235 [Frankiales bacterium]|nr:hypothetical protein [Frankiales bacterium]
MSLSPLPPDRQLAKRLTREARSAAKAQQRGELARAKAVRRHADAVRRARQSLPSQLLLAVGAGVASVPLPHLAGAVAAGVGAVCALGAVRSFRTLRQPTPTFAGAAQPGPVAAPPPDHRSAAWPAVRRLEGVRLELTRLLPLVSPAGRDVAAEAWAAAGEADAALRWQAARLAAVEPHRGTDPYLLRSLHDGVVAQEQLVGAVADLVAASADPLAVGRLQDATDALHGLAQGLREVR